MNTGELWPDPDGARLRVRRMQTKLHQWAVDDPGRRFDDLYNLVHHPDFLTVAWERVRGNKGARTAGVDRAIPAFIADDADTVAFLKNAREQLKARTFTPLPVRERMIPKRGSGGKLRRPGIPTAMDRLVQASLVLVLEPIFEASFKPVSYGFRPERRAHDAIAEVHHLGTKGYHWVLDADIEACFDNIAHSALLERNVRTSRRQAGSGPGQGVPEGGHHVRRRRDQGHEHRHTPRRHRLAAVGEHRSLGTG
ncbi:reverse transcriptase domain-containing protein [Streptomyces sp. KMM 9044]|uniref:reverse transcriptase domain-containing protein n=1 Tax=Streptomyces sp. KMM 9044 TaxID=2744474 RepID=UPI002F413D1E